jgi:hypothetical protein
MPSSISSSEVGGAPAARTPRPTPEAAHERDRYARQTAADRPGIAQPVPTRPVPEQRWGAILLAAFVLFAVLLAGWEAYWRAFGVTPGAYNNYGLWAIQRRRIDAGEGDATVLMGASRLFFDIQLPVWKRLAGKAPIQLCFEGTSPLPYLEDLAADPKFTGRVLIGIAPQVFFTGFRYRDGAAAYTRKESPSQRIGQWLSMNLIEPYFAYDDPDFALETVLARQPWPKRPGKLSITEVRKLSVHEPDRNGYLWSKVTTDPQYRELARNIWREGFDPELYPPPEKLKKVISEQIALTAKAVAKLRARGVKVLFVRMPSSGEYLAFENRMYPRARTWDALLAATGSRGIHFEDYPQLQGYYLPEWSHLTQAEAERFTAALYGIIERDFWGPHVSGGSTSAATTIAGVSPASQAPTSPAH